MPLIDSALDYASKGWPVFPCHISKRPMVSSADGGRGFHDATTDTDLINAWWGMWPNASIGIPTGRVSGFIVLDIDPDKAGMDSLDTLICTHSALPDTVQSITGGGGIHYLFQHPGFYTPTNQSVVGQGIDIRGDGGYIIAPPSHHPSGRDYEWELSSHPDEIPLAAMPDWLLTLIKETKHLDPVNPDEDIPESKRNQTLFRLASQMRRFGWGEEAISVALLHQNTEHCKPPLGDKEVRRIAHNSARYKPEDISPIEEKSQPGKAPPKKGEVIFSPFDVISAEELRVKNVPETRWIVKGLLPEGLASLAGRPKQGKSWLALNLAIAVAMGNKALNDFEIPAASDVLFLALEDNESRIKWRMQLLMREFIPWPGNLDFALFSPRMGAGFVEALKLWLGQKKEPGLVIVDMYTKIAERRKKTSQSDYDDIYEEMAPLQALAYEYHICIMLVMHLNKSTDVEDATARIMGSTAYSGATVTNLILQRLKSHDPADAILIPSGKDIQEEDNIALVFDGGVWISRGEANMYRQSVQRLEILETLFISGRQTPKEIADALDKNSTTIRRLIQGLHEDGLIVKARSEGKYGLTNAGADVLNARRDDEERDRNLDEFENDETSYDTDGPPEYWGNIEPGF